MAPSQPDRSPAVDTTDDLVDTQSTSTSSSIKTVCGFCSFKAAKTCPRALCSTHCAFAGGCELHPRMPDDSFTRLLDIRFGPALELSTSTTLPHTTTPPSSAASLHGGSPGQGSQGDWQDFTLAIEASLEEEYPGLKRRRRTGSVAGRRPSGRRVKKLKVVSPSAIQTRSFLACLERDHVPCDQCYISSTDEESAALFVDLRDKVDQLKTLLVAATQTPSPAPSPRVLDDFPCLSPLGSPSPVTHAPFTPSPVTHSAYVPHAADDVATTHAPFSQGTWSSSSVIDLTLDDSLSDCDESFFSEIAVMPRSAVSFGKMMAKPKVKVEAVDIDLTLDDEEPSTGTRY